MGKKNGKGSVYKNNKILYKANYVDDHLEYMS